MRKTDTSAGEIVLATGKTDGKTAVFATAGAEFARKMAVAVINSTTVRPCSGAFQISSPISPPRSCSCSV